MRLRIPLNVGWAESDGQPLVEVGDRLVAPIIRVHLTGAQGQPQADIVIDSSSGLPRCTSVHVLSSERANEVRTRDLRLLNLEDLVDAVVPLFTSTETVKDADGGVSAAITVPDSNSDAYRRARRAVRNVQRAARRVVTDELLERVAEAYLSDPARPALTVERTLGVSRTTAFRYIREARARGILTEGD